MELRIQGQVTACVCRTTTDGRPVLEVELKTQDGQAVHARHIYPDSTASSSHAAMTLARQLKGKQAELYTTTPPLYVAAHGLPGPTHPRRVHGQPPQGSRMKPALTPINHGSGFGTNRRAIDSAQEPVPSAKALRQRRMRERVTTPVREQPIRASTTKGTLVATELQPSVRPGAMDAFKLPSLISGKRVYPRGHS